MPNALLDDFEHEYHNHLLEKGNLLKKKPREASADLKTIRAWRFTGFTARLSRTICNCGAQSVSLMGIFRDEEACDGARRSIALDPARFEPVPGYTYPTITITQGVAVCPACLPSMGFVYQENPHYANA
jgi:hypothetical protein